MESPIEAPCLRARRPQPPVIYLSGEEVGAFLASGSDRADGISYLLGKTKM